MSKGHGKQGACLWPYCVGMIFESSNQQGKVTNQLEWMLGQGMEDAAWCHLWLLACVVF